MKKSILILSMFLTACGAGNISSASSVNPSSSESSVDYTQFDPGIVGTWYIYSNATGILDLNTRIEITDTYELTVRNIHFNFIGIYAGFEGACLFESDSKITKFIASTDGENLDWAFEDLGGNSDFGSAGKEEYSSELKYSYVGPEWPGKLVSDYLEIEAVLPSYPSAEYSLYTGVSALFNDTYCMIDIFDAKEEAREEYVRILTENGYTMNRSQSSVFIDGYDPLHAYGLRLMQDESNLTVLIYRYRTLYPEADN